MNKELRNRIIDLDLSERTKLKLIDLVDKYLDELYNLQQENKQLKEHIGKYDHYCKTTGIEELMKENQKYKEVIDKVILIIKGIAYGGNEDYYIEKLKDILDILKEVE